VSLIDQLLIKAVFAQIAWIAPTFPQKSQGGRLEGGRNEKKLKLPLFLFYAP